MLPVAVVSSEAEELKAWTPLILRVAASLDEGAVFVGDLGLEPAWPAGDDARVFAYLTPTHAESDALIAALKARRARALVYARALAARRAGHDPKATARRAADLLEAAQR